MSKYRFELNEQDYFDPGLPFRVDTDAAVQRVRDSLLFVQPKGVEKAMKRPRKVEQIIYSRDFKPIILNFIAILLVRLADVNNTLKLEELIEATHLSLDEMANNPVVEGETQLAELLRRDIVWMVLVLIFDFNTKRLQNEDAQKFYYWFLQLNTEALRRRGYSALDDLNSDLQ